MYNPNVIFMVGTMIGTCMAIFNKDCYINGVWLKVNEAWNGYKIKTVI